MSDGLITYIEGRKVDQKMKFFAKKRMTTMQARSLFLNEERQRLEIVAGALQDSRERS
jgi:hypothetical protein